MKAVITSLFLLFCLVRVNAQENNIITKNVQIEEFIPFVVNNFSKGKKIEKYRNLTFLIPVTNLDEVDETSILLNQGFRLLLNRLNEKDRITLVAYSAINGEVLKSTSVKKVKKILYAIENINESVSRLFDDGIQLGYDIADANFDEAAINMVVMIRSSVKVSKSNIVEQEVKPKKEKSNLFLLTLLSLAPEILNILKD